MCGVTLHRHMYLSKHQAAVPSLWSVSLLVVASVTCCAGGSFRAANGGAVGVLGIGVTLTNLTGNIFEANTADNTLSSATNDGDGGM